MIILENSSSHALCKKPTFNPSDFEMGTRFNYYNQIKAIDEYLNKYWNTCLLSKPILFRVKSQGYKTDSEIIEEKRVRQHIIIGILSPFLAASLTVVFRLLFY